MNGYNPRTNVEKETGTKRKRALREEEDGSTFPSLLKEVDLSKQGETRKFQRHRRRNKKVQQKAAKENEGQVTEQRLNCVKPSISSGKRKSRYEAGNIQRHIRG